MSGRSSKFLRNSPPLIPSGSVAAENRIRLFLTVSCLLAFREPDVAVPETKGDPPRVKEGTELRMAFSEKPPGKSKIQKCLFSNSIFSATAGRIGVL